MPKNDESKSAKLLEEYHSAVAEDRQVSIDDLVSRCPSSERDSLREAIAATDFFKRNYEGFLAPPHLIQEVDRRISELNRRKTVVRKARERLSRETFGERLISADIQTLLQRVLAIQPQELPTLQNSPTSLMYRNRAPEASSDKMRTAINSEMAIAQASSHAEQLWTKAGSPGPPVEPKSIAEMLGLPVIELPVEGCDGCILVQGDEGGILVNAAIDHAGRKRFTIAHELGHFDLHKRSLVFRQETLKDIESSSSGMEAEANAFASTLLMPTRLMKPEFTSKKPSFWVIDEIAERYKVSITAAALRLVQLSDFGCAVLYSSADRVLWSAKSDYFPYFLERGGPLNKHTAAAALLADSTKTELSRKSLASWWAPTDSRAENAEVMEHSRIGYGGSVLTLLYVPE